jgi:hypothetical protein
MNEKKYFISVRAFFIKIKNFFFIFKEYNVNIKFTLKYKFLNTSKFNLNIYYYNT